MSRLRGRTVGATTWRTHRLLSIGRLFIGLGPKAWKERYIRRSTTIRNFTPGAQYLSRSGPSLSVKLPGLPFEIVVGYWRLYVLNVFADTPGVETVSIGSDPETATPISEYHQDNERRAETHLPAFLVDGAGSANWQHSRHG